MNAGYIRAARIHLPNAVEKIAFDRFHVAKQLGEVVDKTRQNEHPHLPVESRRQAKGTRFLWQYSDKWMTESRQEKLMWLREQMQQTSQCWTLKELAKISGIAPGAQNAGMTGCSGYRWRLNVMCR